MMLKTLKTTDLLPRLRAVRIKPLNRSMMIAMVPTVRRPLPSNRWIFGGIAALCAAILTVFAVRRMRHRSSSRSTPITSRNTENMDDDVVSVQPVYRNQDIIDVPTDQAFTSIPVDAADDGVGAHHDEIRFQAR